MLFICFQKPIWTLLCVWLMDCVVVRPESTLWPTGGVSVPRQSTTDWRFSPGDHSLRLGWLSLLTAFKSISYLRCLWFQTPFTELCPVLCSAIFFFFFSNVWCELNHHFHAIVSYVSCSLTSSAQGTRAASKCVQGYPKIENWRNTIN